MMELTPEEFNGSVVMRLSNICRNKQRSCAPCQDYIVAVYNWFKSNELGYALIDLQFGRDICNDFIFELLQIRMRLHIPFYFTGVSKKPKAILETYQNNQTQSTAMAIYHFFTSNKIFSTIAIIHQLQKQCRYLGNFLLQASIHHRF